MKYFLYNIIVLFLAVSVFWSADDHARITSILGAIFFYIALLDYKIGRIGKR